MRLLKVTFTFGVCTILAGCVAISEDISPDLPNASAAATATQANGSYAGVTVAVAGDENTLYAISLNAGIWRADNGDAWHQLQSSPGDGQVIAVDPGDSHHVVVGARSGLWGSRDGGQTWAVAMNPQSFGCWSSIIGSTAFDESRNLFIGSLCGVFEQAFAHHGITTLSGAGAPTGLVTGLAITSADHLKPWVWARTSNTLFLYQEETNAWQSADFPTVVGSDSISRGAAGDQFALAAYFNTAFTIVSVQRPRRDDLSADCQKKIPMLVTKNAALNYTIDKFGLGHWSIDDIGAGDGTGLGGHRFVRAFPARGSTPTTLLAGAAQNVFMRTVNGAVNDWKDIAESNWNPGPCDRYDLSQISTVHSDMWNVHFGDAADPAIWISGDGGVYRTSFSSAVNAANGISPPYSQQNEGLHTHHIHTISTVRDDPNRGTRLLYPTTDNDVWYRDSLPFNLPSDWVFSQGLGDANDSASDTIGSNEVIAYRSNTAVRLIGFNQVQVCADPTNAQNPECTGNRFALSQNPSKAYDSQYFSVIQSVRNAPPNGYLDVATIKMFPDFSDRPGPDIPVILRAKKFSDAPTAPNWTDVIVPLPNGAQRVWTTGGHVAPIYYVYSEGTTGPAVSRRDPTGNWTDLTSAIGGTLMTPFMGMRGPIFVDPYVQDRVFVLTATDVRMSPSLGVPFKVDPVLTALITRSSTYPIRSDFTGDDDTIGFYDIYYPDVSRNTCTKAATAATLTQIAFDPDDANQYVAAAPAAGVFFFFNGTWHDLTPLLPTPLSEVSSVSIDHDAIYVALEGRGLFRIRDYYRARIAAYFVRQNLAAGQLAVLMSADGSPLSSRYIRVVAYRGDGSLVVDRKLTTDAMGVLATPTELTSSSGPYRVRLTSMEDDNVAPAFAAFPWP